MNELNRAANLLSRRALLAKSGCGFGLLGLASLLGEQGMLGGSLAAADDATQPAAAVNPLAAKQPQFDAKAKSVIWLFINGGPSHVDTWEYKPALEKYDGKELEGFDKFTGFFAGSVGPLMKSPSSFSSMASAASTFRRFSPIWPNMSTRWLSCIRAIPSRTITAPRCL